MHFCETFAKWITSANSWKMHWHSFCFETVTLISSNSFPFLFFSNNYQTQTRIRANFNSIKIFNWIFFSCIIWNYTYEIEPKFNPQCGYTRGLSLSLFSIFFTDNIFYKRFQRDEHSKKQHVRNRPYISCIISSVCMCMCLYNQRVKCQRLFRVKANTTHH